jgi:AcrR family transcriptional regulator
MTSRAGEVRRRRGPQVGKAPAPGLSRERIVAAALELVASGGLAALSTRRLGERLGCEAMSIYHHFPGKQHLLDALVDQVIASLEWPPQTLSPLEQLRALMHAYRAMAHRFPAMFPLVALHRLNTPTGVRFIERVLAIVQAVVPDPQRAARHFRTIGYYLMGAGLDETAGYAKGPSAAEPVDDEFIARECPRLAAAAEYFRRDQWDATFEQGAEAMLAAVAADAGGSGRPS